MTEPGPPLPAKLQTILDEASQAVADRFIRSLEGELLVLEENPPEGRQGEVKRLAAMVRQGRRLLDRKYPPVEPLTLDAILDKVKERIE
jgi:hypothetical protein